MDRLACIDLPAFPLQLLTRAHPEWAAGPVAVVDEDKPLGRILWINERARRCRILPGMRYAAALSLASALCAGVVPEGEIAAAIDSIVKLLRRFSPDIEPSRDDPGVFWARATGLERLHPSLARWASEMHSDLSESGLSSRIVVGFTRFGTYAIARSGPGPIALVVDSPAEERARTRKVELARLNLSPAVRDPLHALGIDTVGQLLALPANGLRKRFGPDVHRLVETARGDLSTPLTSLPEDEPLARHIVLDYPEIDVTRLDFLIKHLLHPLLNELAARCQALAELKLELRLDRLESRTECLRPAEPTLDARQLLNLVHLRLESLELGAGITELVLDAVAAPATAEQLSLFALEPRRDLAAASRALARVRAEFGDDAVVRARLGEGHLPEAQYGWEPILKVSAPRPRDQGQRPRVRRTPVRRTLVRRLHLPAIPLPHRLRHRDDGWLFSGRDDVPVDLILGPYVISGGWWRAEIRREYHFIQNRRGTWLWVYFDPERQRWFLQGRVE